MIDINELIKSSMKSGDKVALRAYKNLKAEIQLVQTAKNAKPYTGAIEMQIISKMCKKLEDAIKDFSKAHREDLVSDYTSELEVLKKLLPEPINESLIYSELGKWCFENNFVEADPNNKMPCSIETYYLKIPKKEMGKAIKHLKEIFPQADGKMVSSIVKKHVI